MAGRRKLKKYVGRTCKMHIFPKHHRGIREEIILQGYLIKQDTGSQSWLFCLTTDEKKIMPFFNGITNADEEKKFKRLNIKHFPVFAHHLILAQNQHKGHENFGKMALRDSSHFTNNLGKWLSQTAIDPNKERGKRC